MRQKKSETNDGSTKPEVTSPERIDKNVQGYLDPLVKSLDNIIERLSTNLSVNPTVALLIFDLGVGILLLIFATILSSMDMSDETLKTIIYAFLGFSLLVVITYSVVYLVDQRWSLLSPENPDRKQRKEKKIQRQDGSAMITFEEKLCYTKWLNDLTPREYENCGYTLLGSQFNLALNGPSTPTGPFLNYVLTLPGKLDELRRYLNINHQAVKPECAKQFDCEDEEITESDQTEQSHDE